MNDDHDGDARTGGRRPLPGAGARSAELPDVAVPDDMAIGRDVARDPGPADSTKPAAGALPADAYRTGGPTGTRPVPPGSGAPLTSGRATPEDGEPGVGDPGDRRGGADREGGLDPRDREPGAPR